LTFLIRYTELLIKHAIEPPLLEAPQEPLTKLLLVEDNPGDVRAVEETLAAQNIARFTVVATATLGEALIRLGGERFDAVLLDLKLPDARGLDSLVGIRCRAPSTPIVIMTGLSDEALAIKAVNAGAQDYLVKGEADGFALARRLRFAIERGRSSVRSMSAEPLMPSRTLGFIGSKGGVGASTIACYLGMALKAQTKEPVLLADFDFESAVLAFLMDVETKYSLADALENVDRLDADLWKSLVHTKSSGLDIIGSSFAMIPDEKSFGQFQRVLSFLRSRYRWIIADLGRGISENLAILLRDVDETYVVTTLELAALRQARLMIQKLKQLGRHPDSLRLVLNELPKRSPFSSANLEEMLGFPVWATIPYIPELRENHGRSTSLPITATLGKAIASMTEQVAGIPEAKPRRRWSSI
jgi:Flp pilus assembly CpaE family ATPase